MEYPVQRKGDNANPVGVPENTPQLEQEVTTKTHHIKHGPVWPREVSWVQNEICVYKHATSYKTPAQPILSSLSSLYLQ